ncbi:hypothetical protein [Candidatus Harpocratesius sp.]
MNNCEEWETEIIPDDNFIFRRIHKNFVINDSQFPNMQKVPQNVFNEPKKSWKEEYLAKWDGVSVDWDRYSTAEETLKRGEKESTNYGVIQSEVFQVRSVQPLDVIHRPIKNHEKLKDNRAHSLITGFTFANKVEIRMNLAEKFTWSIQGWR